MRFSSLLLALGILGCATEEPPPPPWTYPALGSHVMPTSVGFFPEGGRPSDCCLDLDGDGDDDNFIAGVMNSNIEGGVMPHALLRDAFDEAPAFTFAFRGLDGSLSPEMSWAPGEIAGAGVRLDAAWIQAETRAPVARFGPVAIEGGQLVASGGELILPLPDRVVCAPAPLGGSGLLFIAAVFGPVVVREVRVEATIAEEAGGVRLTEGRLGGSLRVVEWVTNANARFAERCADMPVALFESEERDGQTYATCTDSAGVSCPTDVCPTDPDEAWCTSVACTCANDVTISILESFTAADIDLDGDGTFESMSVGVMFEGDPVALLDPT